MKCAMEILEAKKIGDMERAERKRQEELAKEAAKQQRREEAKPATFQYAEQLVQQLYNRAKNGEDLKITRNYDVNQDGLYRQMTQDEEKYSNGVKPWYTSKSAPLLNLDYLTELLTDLCYKVERNQVSLHVNSCRTEKFHQITISVPASLPCK